MITAHIIERCYYDLYCMLVASIGPLLLFQINAIVG